MSAPSAIVPRSGWIHEFEAKEGDDHATVRQIFKVRSTKSIVEWNALKHSDSKNQLTPEIRTQYHIYHHRHLQFEENTVFVDEAAEFDKKAGIMVDVAVAWGDEAGESQVVHVDINRPTTRTSSTREGTQAIRIPGVNGYVEMKLIVTLGSSSRLPDGAVDWSTSTRVRIVELECYSAHRKGRGSCLDETYKLSVVKMFVSGCDLCQGEGNCSFCKGPPPGYRRVPPSNQEEKGDEDVPLLHTTTADALIQFDDQLTEFGEQWVKKMAPPISTPAEDPPNYYPIRLAQRNLTPAVQRNLTPAVRRILFPVSGVWSVREVFMNSPPIRVPSATSDVPSTADNMDRPLIEQRIRDLYHYGRAYREALHLRGPEEDNVRLYANLQGYLATDIAFLHGVANLLRPEVHPRITTFELPPRLQVLSDEHLSRLSWLLRGQAAPSDLRWARTAGPDETGGSILVAWDGVDDDTSDGDFDAEIVEVEGSDDGGEQEEEAVADEHVADSDHSDDQDPDFHSRVADQVRQRNASGAGARAPETPGPSHWPTLDDEQLWLLYRRLTPQTTPAQMDINWIRRHLLTNGQMVDEEGSDGEDSG